MPEEKTPITVRAATPADIPSISAIHAYYVQNTVITFKTTATTEVELLANLEKIQKQNLPYLVATTPNEGVVGYTYVSGFRSGKGGYIHTVELSLFAHPDHLYKGIGTVLLRKLIDVLKTPEEHLELINGVRAEEQKVRHIIACMSVNTDGKEDGLGLKNWYEGFGFVLKGHLKEVGYKFDRWIDTMYLQLTLW